jgi:sucrose-6-phosphate hydrolase SacC (GH32 family)
LDEAVCGYPLEADPVKFRAFLTGQLAPPEAAGDRLSKLQRRLSIFRNGPRVRRVFGVPKQGGCVLLYRSRDLHSWVYLHPLVTGRWNGTSQVDPVDSGEMWECPDCFELDGKHVPLYSTERKVYWSIGELDRDDMIFHPKSHGLLDTGAFYAPKTMLDKQGRRVLWGWIPETRSASQYERAGWAGSMALPRLLNVDTDGLFKMKPLPELQSLRTHQPADARSFKSFRGEVIACVSGSGAIEVGPDKRPYVTVGYSSVSPL